jgi:hypothetical protein
MSKGNGGTPSTPLVAKISPFDCNERVSRYGAKLRQSSHCHPRRLSPSEATPDTQFLVKLIVAATLASDDPPAYRVTALRA